MIVIDRIRINGFRSIQSLKMPLERSTVLLGTNNCGKSTVLKALELALSDETSVAKEDFHLDAEGNFATQLWVDVRFIPLNQEGKRLSIFDDEWHQEFGRMTSRDHYRREYFAFRTLFKRHPDGTIEKRRFLITHWDAEKIGFELAGLPRSIQFVSIDAEENLRAVNHKLRDIDEVYILASGEFEDLLPQGLVERTLGYAFENISLLDIKLLDSDVPRVKILEEIFKTRGLHEFKKAEFANLVKINIKDKSDLSDEIIRILDKITANKKELPEKVPS